MSRGTPILYIPGIMGSQLYTPEDGKKIWFSPAAVLTDSERLDISSDLAVKNNGIDLQTKKPIQREYGVLKQDILLIEWLCSMFPDTPVYFFSYDFRKSCRKAAAELHEQIERIIADGAESVNIVCHSMGGLVTSAYVSRCGTRRLNKVVMLGVPFEGSHEILRIYLTGNLREIPNMVIETVGITREMLAGFPSLAELMPTKRLLAAHPLEMDGHALSGVDQEILIASKIPETYVDARVFQREVRSGFAQLKDMQNCYFGIGTGKTTLETIRLFVSGKNPEMIETREGDGQVLTDSALMGGDLCLEDPQVREFPVHHSNLLRHPNVLKWITDCLNE